ncbi:MAG: hypothetical protein C4530_12605 [Desulfobacteraceae bacterium]|nr:MAG: hypothetical protein C4530_12605 [Desulfobacteraceae bacterium]
MNQANIEKIKTGAWGAVGGAVVAMIIGFGWGGWVLGGTSQSNGEEMAQTAVADRLTPICFAQFNQDPQRDEKLKILKEKSSWDRGGYVKAQGWATMPFEKEADRLVADQCSELILKDSK